MQLLCDAGGGLVLLRRWLYGKRNAVDTEDAYYFLAIRRLPCFTICRGREHVIEHMRSWQEVEFRSVFGARDGEDKCVTMLNRILHWRLDRLSLEVDPEHARRICEDMGFTAESKRSEVLGARLDESREPDNARDGHERLQTISGHRGDCKPIVHGQEDGHLVCSEGDVLGHGPPDGGGLAEIQRLGQVYSRVPAGRMGVHR